MNPPPIRFWGKVLTPSQDPLRHRVCERCGALWATTAPSTLTVTIHTCPDCVTGLDELDDAELELAIKREHRRINRRRDNRRCQRTPPPQLAPSSGRHPST